VWDVPLDHVFVCVSGREDRYRGLFTDPSLEHVSEETGNEVVLMKDRSGRVIGFEKLNFLVPESDSVHVVVETAPA